MPIKLNSDTAQILRQKKEAKKIVDQILDENLESLMDDEGSATFAKQFYESYGSESPARALAIAQREMIRDETYSAPYYWAGYQLLGDGAGQASSQ